MLTTSLAAPSEVATCDKYLIEKRVVHEFILKKKSHHVCWWQKNLQSFNCLTQFVEKKDTISQLLQQRFPNLFSRIRRIKDNKGSIELKRNTTVSQQKGRHIPIQLQTAVSEGIKKLLLEGDIEQIDQIPESELQ